MAAFSLYEVNPVKTYRGFATWQRVAQMRWVLLTLLFVGWVIVPHHLRAASASSFLVFVGTYTASTSKGIYNYRFDSNTGKLTLIGMAAELPNPSFLASDPQHRFLYAVTEMGNEPGADCYDKNGFLSSYSIDRKSGALTFLNKVDAGGSASCHLVVDKTGKMLFVANYWSGNVASFAIKADGSIGERTGFYQHTGCSVDPARQTGPHAHAVVLSPDNRFLFVPDLGTDRIHIYRVDAAKGTFTTNDPPPFATVKGGLGPRHFIFGREAKFAYTLCEMGSSVAVFSYDPVKGSLTPVQTISNLPSDFTGEDNSAEIEVDASGRFLYASNRGHDSITVFSIDPAKGTLTTVQVVSTQGKIPRNFAIDPSGKWLIAANQHSDNLVIFAIDPKDGQLKPAGETPGIAMPVTILFVPAE
jgi:6-phosphogluconolactonase